MDKFYTLKGYALLEANEITHSMEDYLEMIYRLYISGEVVRIGALADSLNVKPSSASKMVGNLRKQGLISSEKYNYIKMTPVGVEKGKYLVYRHDVLHRFLCFVNGTDNELAQVEKIEHFLDERTVRNIGQLLEMLN